MPIAEQNETKPQSFTHRGGSMTVTKATIRQVIRDARRDKQFWQILRNLECRLQELGCNSDFGVPTEPSFATETLVSAICYVTKLSGAKEGLQLEAAQDLVDCELRREAAAGNPGFKCVGTMRELMEKHDANERLFRQLVAEYKSRAQL